MLSDKESESVNGRFGRERGKKGREEEEVETAEMAGRRQQVAPRSSRHAL